MVVSTQTSISGSTLHIRVDVRNEGTDEAYRVVPRIEFRDQHFAGATADVLEPSSTLTTDFDIPTHDVVPGRGSWPLVARVQYHDVNGSVHEATHLAVAAIGAPRRMDDASAAGIAMSGVRVSGAADLTAYIEPRAVRSEMTVTFITPTAIVTNPVTTRLRAADRTQLSVRTEVAAPASSVGNSLPVFAVLEYDVDGEHQTMVARVLLEIVAEPNRFSTRTVMSVALVVLVASWVVIAIPAMWRRSRHAS